MPFGFKYPLLQTEQFLDWTSLREIKFTERWARVYHIKESNRCNMTEFIEGQRMP